MPVSAEPPYVVAAYAITWIVMAGYALYSTRLVRRTRDQLMALEGE